MTTIHLTSTDSSENLEIRAEQSEAVGRIDFCLSDVVWIAHEEGSKTDFTASSDWEHLEEWINEAKFNLHKRYQSKANPVSVKDNRIRVVESEIMYDTPYTVDVEGDIYQIIFTSDGNLEIYEVAI